MKIKWYQVYHNKLSVQQHNCEIQLVYFWSAGGWTQDLVNIKHVLYHPATLRPTVVFPSVVRSHEGSWKSYLVLLSRPRCHEVLCPTNIQESAYSRTHAGTHTCRKLVSHQHTSLQGTPTWLRQEKQEFKPALATWWLKVIGDPEAQQINELKPKTTCGPGGQNLVSWR